MSHLRRFATKHLTVIVIAAAVLAALVVWKVVTAEVGGRVSAPPVTAVQPAVAAHRGGSGPAGSAALRAAGHLEGVTVPALPGTPTTGQASPVRPSGPAAPAAGSGGTATVTAQPLKATAPPAGTGRPDPFSPLASPTAGAAASPPALPPVPPLSPNALGPAASSTPGGTATDAAGAPGQLQLTGIVFGPGAVAILRDATGSYIGESGDTVASGVRIVAIDAANQSVTLASNGQSWQLLLGGGKSR